MHFWCYQSFKLFIFLAFQCFYLSIFLASSGSFTVKNDNIHSFFLVFSLQIWNLLASLQKKNTRVGLFPWKQCILHNPDRERTNQSTGICPRLGLPCNKIYYPTALCRVQISCVICTPEDWLDRFSRNAQATNWIEVMKKIFVCQNEFLFYLFS